MLSRYRVQPIVIGVLSLAAFLAVGCSNMSNPLSASSSSQTGQAFLIGTDAPAASIVSFAVQDFSMDAIDSKGNSVPLISGSPTVDFARYNGLQALLSLNNVPVGTYSSVSITLGPATIGYLDTSTAEPSIQTEPAALTTSTVNITLPTPLVITKTVSMGLRVDFNLFKSIETSGGQITGKVNPTFTVTVVKPGDSGGHIDELVGGVVSVNSTAQSFVLQRPNGRQFTIDTDGQTEWDNNANLSLLIPGHSIVQISGEVDNAQATINADEVAILSQHRFYASGQVTYVTPASGAAKSFDLYVRGLEPTNTDVQLGTRATVVLSDSEKYFIYWMRNPMAAFLFNSSALVAGQDVAIGGPLSDATSPTDVGTNRVVLRPWGFTGTVVAGSVDSGNGTFQMQVNGFAGVLIPTPVTVYVAGKTDYRDGFGSFDDVTGGAKVRVVGLLLKNPTSGQLVLLARYVDDMKGE